MGKTILIFVICLPGLLSASCSSSSSGSTSTSVGANEERQVMYNGESGSSSANKPNYFSPAYYPSVGTLMELDSPSQQTFPEAELRSDECKNGWCGEDGSCICNPCWSGPTCQEYVDRFAPRFLAEEPFFIVDASSGGYSTFLDPAFDPIYPQQWTASSDIQGDSSLSTTQSTTTSSQSSSSSSGPNAGVSYSLPQHIHAQPPPPGPAPLFRIESADDDLGLTCQLGQVGPAATCPCATPRYKVVGATTTFPESLSSQKSEFRVSSDSVSEDTSKDNNNNSFGNPPTISTDETSKSSFSGERQKVNQSHDHNNNPFWADEETGDVFLHEGFKLQPSKHYFITLQVSALQMNKSGYKPWKDEVIATLYVKPSVVDVQEGEGAAVGQPWNSGEKVSPETEEELFDRSGEETRYSSEREGKDNEDNSNDNDDTGEEQGGERDDDDGRNQVSEEDLDNKRSFGNGKSGSSSSLRKRRIISTTTTPSTTLRNSKNKLPYALRGDRPHYKFEDYQGGSSYTERVDSFIPQDESHPFLHRWKRHVLSKNPRLEDFELTLSRLTTRSLPSDKIRFGDKIKMQLVIQVPSVESVDFDIEIISSNDDPRFAILSAHVSSIGSDITFDKELTNLAPILKPSKNMSLYESAIWHWKSVRRGAKNEPSRSNTGITIEFDIVPVKMDGGSYSNASRHNPLLQLSSLRSSSVASSSSLSKSRSLAATNVNPLGKMTKDFNTYLVPIRARLSFPLHHRIIHSGESGAHHHPDKSNYEKISQRLISVYFDPTPSKNVSRKHHRTHVDPQDFSTSPKATHGIISSPSVKVEIEGPREIPQGEWKSYTIKVYLKQSCRFKLTVEQNEGNTILDQDSISVGDIRLVTIGQRISACSEIPEKRGFRVSCKKSGGRKGDVCSVESPFLSPCPPSKKLPVVKQGQEMRGDGRQTKGEVENEMDENVLQFEGIIYGLPGAPPGSQFVLKAHVYSEVMSTGLSTQIAQDEQTVAGRIVRRRVELGRHISSHSSGPDGMNDDHMDGKISIMPKGEDVGLEGIERRQDPNQLSSDTRKPSFIARSRTLKRVQRSLMFPAASRNLYNRLLNGRSRLGGKHTRKSAITDNHQQPSPNSEEQSSLFQSFDNPVTPNSEILS